jgi:hypothetical protein
MDLWRRPVTPEVAGSSPVVRFSSPLVEAGAAAEVDVADHPQLLEALEDILDAAVFADRDRRRLSQRSPV